MVFQFFTIASCLNNTRLGNHSVVIDFQFFTIASSIGCQFADRYVNALSILYDCFRQVKSLAELIYKHFQFFTIASVGDSEKLGYSVIKLSILYDCFTMME